MAMGRNKGREGFLVVATGPLIKITQKDQLGINTSLSIAMAEGKMILRFFREVKAQDLHLRTSHGYFLPYRLLGLSGLFILGLLGLQNLIGLLGFLPGLCPFSIAAFQIASFSTSVAFLSSRHCAKPCFIAGFCGKINETRSDCRNIKI